jgi:hypothetical protein
MIRDPFYQDIVTGLSGTLDPELFEQCATDLLQTIYPSLTPIRGGSDSGMDGAMADGEGHSFPLTCTVGEKVLGNMTGSLESYLKDGGSRRKVIVATSQALTPLRRKNLEVRASELGFELIQIHDQASFANLLYRNSAWCRELLNLSGEPPALSAYPLSVRIQDELPLIGRDDDLQWISERPGDSMIVGQPGVGKTYLFQALVQADAALFVNDEDEGRIATGIRDQQPSILIVDDAHVRNELLSKLQNIRTQMGGSYRIIASCWPGDQENVARHLGVVSNSILQIGLLTRDQIVDVVKASGISGPNELIREIVNQAYGKPGLAATLSHFCRYGDIERVALGDALSQDIKSYFEPFVGKLASEVLAVFSLGGATGMQMTGVAKELGLPLVEVRNVAIQLAAGGVLEEKCEGTLSVVPPRLRHALVRDVFFQGAASLPVDGLLSHISSAHETCLVLVGAKALGGNISDGFLFDHLLQANSSGCWEAYAWLGRQEASRVLDELPEKLISVANAALSSAPEKVIPLLLSASIGDERPLNSATDHPLRRLKDWIQSANKGSDEPANRRLLLLEASIAWWKSGGSPDTALIGVCNSFSPELSSHDSDPGAGRRITFTRGLLDLDSLKALEASWEIAKEFISSADFYGWQPVITMVEDWIYPGRMLFTGGSVPEPVAAMMKSFAVQMLSDLAEIAQNHPAIIRWIHSKEKTVGVELSVHLDDEFLKLYPYENLERYEASDRENEKAVKELSKTLVKQSPTDVANRIVNYEREALRVGLDHPRFSPCLCRELATDVKDPSEWAHELYDLSAPADLVAPFLEEAIKVDTSLWEMVADCIQSKRYRYMGFRICLLADNLPDHICEAFMAALSETEVRFILWEVRREPIDEEMIKHLLAHAAPEIAAAAAIGLWHAESKREILDRNKEKWVEAFLKGNVFEHSALDIFKSDSNLALRWLKQRSQDDPDCFWRKDHHVLRVLELLNEVQRMKLILSLEEHYYSQSFINALVGDDSQLYEALLSRAELKQLHLMPLKGPINEQWVSKAKQALEAGCSPEDISEAVHGEFRIIEGNPSNYYADWLKQFGSIEMDANDRIREIACIGIENASLEMKAALEQEQIEAIRGH